MHDWLHHSSRLRPDAPFLTTPAGSFSFAQFDGAVMRRAGSLVEQGVVAGDRVGVFAANTAEAALDLFAVPRAGATLVLLNTRHTDAELEQQLRRASAQWVLGTRADLGARLLERGDGSPPAAVDAPETHTIAFTSGTSGRPAGVKLTAENLESSAAASAEHLQHRPDDRWLCVMPLFHVGGLMILIRSAREGSEVVLERRFDPVRTGRLLKEVTVASLVPTMLARVLDADEGPYRGLRGVLVGGAGASQSLLDRAFTAGLPVMSTYGMTESCSQIATAPLGEPPRRRVRPLPGAEVRVVTSGEIEIRGRMVSTAHIDGDERDPAGWLPTGDLGVWDDGELEVIGRKSDRIITGGENVDPLEVEIALEEVDGVVEALVVGVQDDEWGEAVAAVVAGPAADDVSVLERALRERLAGYKVPRRWLQLPGIPRTSIGKPDRQTARLMFDEVDGG